MPQRLLLAAGMQQEQVAHLSMHQVLEKHGGNLRAVVVNSIVDSVRRHVVPILDENKLMTRRGGPARRNAMSPSRMHLVKRLAQQAVYAGGNEIFADLLKLLATDEKDAAEDADGIRRKVEALLEAHFSDASEASETSPARTGGEARSLSAVEARAFADELLELAAKSIMDRSGVRLMDDIAETPDVFVQSVVSGWKGKIETYVPTKASSAYERYARRKAGEGGFEDQVPALLEELDELYEFRSQYAFDRARTAEVRDATHAEIPVIAGLYQSAVLRETALSLLLTREGDTNESVLKRINTFRRRIAKGVFIREVTEESLERDMSSDEAHKTGLQLKVEVLASKDPDYTAAHGHGILAFATHYRPLATESPRGARRRRKTLREYLERGETRGKASYSDQQKKEFLLAHLDDLILCGDIRGVEQYAPERLGAYVFANMMHEHDLDPSDEDKARDKILLAYRLHHLKLACSQPVIRDLNAVGISLENDSSEELMMDWGFTHASIDQNGRREGDHVRTVVDRDSGARFLLNPVWQMMHASLREADAAASQLWQRRGQRTHGDVTTDRPKKPIIRWRPLP